MPIDLYYVLASPPCRSVMLLAKDLGVKLNLKLINPPAGDARTPEYLKINPQGTIPAMDDDGYILCESRAILRYLNNKFATDDRLYPLDLKARGMVDQRLDFDCGSFFPAFLNCVRPVFFGLTKTVSEEKKERNKEVMGLLDKFLETSGGYVAGKHLTLADYAFVAVAVSFEKTGLADPSEYKHIQSWMEKCKTEMKGYEEINVTGAQQVAQFFKSKLGDGNTT